MSGRPRARRPQARRRRSATPRRSTRRRLPRLGRLVAAAGAVGLAATLVWLLNAPLLRVERVAVAGEGYTPDEMLRASVGEVVGQSLLTIDAGAIARRVSQLPAIESSRVEVRLDGSLSLTVTERTPAFVWETEGPRFLAAGDGTLLALAGAEEPAPAELPTFLDRRGGSRYLVVGDRLEDGMVAVALRLAAIEPTALGSSAASLAVELDDEHGFLLATPDWRAALGFIAVGPGADVDGREELIEQQVAAIRTLFATRPEAEVGWVDARNPGKVYWRAKG